MGKRLIQQARGKGGPTYRAPSHKYKGKVKHPKANANEGTIIDIDTCRGHSAPVAKIKYDNGETIMMVAPEGVQVNGKVNAGDSAKVKTGNTLKLGDLPDGTLVFNIEGSPGDGGKFCRTGGSFARIVTQTEDNVIVMLPSKKQKQFKKECRATIGIVAGGGRLEKPFLKAGKMHFAKRAKNKIWPVVSGSAMNAVDHPFGNKRTSRKARSRPTSRNAPPGRKVGKIAPKRTGLK